MSDFKSRKEYEKWKADKVKGNQKPEPAVFIEPTTPFLSNLFYCLSALSILSSLYLQTEMNTPIWLIGGVIEAALFAFFGQSIKHLKAIYENTAGKK